MSRRSDYDEEYSNVSDWSVVRVKFNTYSLPSRAIGETLTVRIYDRHMEVRYGGVQHS